jgi:protein involved in polysaccharide export with SLBB domain
MLRTIAGSILLAALLLPSSLAGQDRLRAVSYGVRPGDEVTIRVFTSAGAQLQEISGPRIVDPDGRIFLPYLGSVGVSGLSATQIRQLLADEYALLYSDPVVEVLSKLKVNVTGAVRNPGHYLLDPSSTLIDALANAGGVGSEVDIGSYIAADPAASRIVRNGELFLLDLTPNTADPSVFSLPVQSGDWIHIPVAERSRVRETVQFWSGIMSLALSTAALIILVGG